MFGWGEYPKESRNIEQHSFDCTIWPPPGHPAAHILSVAFVAVPEMPEQVISLQRADDRMLPCGITHELPAPAGEETTIGR